MVVAAIAIAIATSSSSDKPTQQRTGGTQSQGNQSVPSPSISHAQTSKPASTTSGSIPTGYLGSWQGSVTGGGLPQPLAIAVTVVQGRPGDAVGTVTNDGGGGQICRIKTSLVSADATRMVLRVIPNTVSAGCVPIVTDQIYTLNQDGTMRLSLGAYLADLSKQ